MKNLYRIFFSARMLLTSLGTYAASIKMSKILATIMMLLTIPAYAGLTYDSTVDISTEVGTTSITFNANGTTLYVADHDSQKVHSFTLSSAYDPTTATPAGSVAIVPASSETYAMGMTGMVFNSNGKIVYFIDPTNDLVYKSEPLSNPYDITSGDSTSSLDVSKMTLPSIPSSNSFFTDMKFSGDGSVLFFINSDGGSSTREIYSYTLSSAYDPSTAGTATVYDLTSNTSIFDTTDIKSIGFNSDGSTLLVGGYNGIVYQGTLSKPYNVSTVTWNGEVNVQALSAGNVSLHSIAFTNSDTELYLLDAISTEIYKYTVAGGSLINPTITITAAEVSDGDTSTDAILSLTFTTSASTTNFTAGDITVSNGVISSFSGSGTTYTATFTPTAAGATTIDVAANTFTNGADNNLAATQFNWTYALSPTMTITAAEVSDGDSSYDSSLFLTFTTSASTTDFTAGDITVSNGVISSFSGSGTTYTATFTPTAAGPTTIDVLAAKFKDGAGSDNTAAAQFNWTYSTDTTSPTVTITAAGVSGGDTSDDETLTLTFTVSESHAGFTSGDITVTNGAISNFVVTANPLVYTATFTPTNAGAATIDVAAATFTDTAGNDNLAATQFNWTYGSDPTTKADVMGNTSASTNAAVNFSHTSLNAVTRRLKWLNDHKDSTNKSYQGVKVSFANPWLQELVNGSSNGLQLTDASTAIQKYGANPDQIMSDAEVGLTQLAMAEVRDEVGGVNLNPTGGAIIGDWAGWTEGQITIGKSGATASASEQKTDAYSITLGMDRPYKDGTGIVGVSLTLGKTDVDVGASGGGVESDNYGLSTYSVIQLEELPQIETTVGLGHMQMGTKRMDGSQILTGDRDANMVFGSILARQETFNSGDFSLSPYGRLEASYIELTDYSEAGGNKALHFNKQRINRSMAFVGAEIFYEATVGNGRIHPFGKLEYGVDLTPASDVDMQYVTNISQNYHTSLDRAATSHWKIGLGFEYENKSDLVFGFNYEREEALNAGYSDTVKLSLDMPL